MKLNIPKAIICTVIALLAALALWQIPGADSCNGALQQAEECLR